MARKYWPENDIEPVKTQILTTFQQGFPPWGDFVQYPTINKREVTRTRRKQNIKSALAANGYLPVLPFTGHYRDRSLTTGEVETSWTNYGSPVLVRSVDTHFANYFDHSWVGWEAARQSAYNIAAAKLNARVRDQRVSVIETIYESGKSRRMILETLSTLTSAARDVKQGRLSDAAKKLGLAAPPKTLLRGYMRHKRKTLHVVISPARTTQEFASRWLAFRYGWGPLYYTVYGAMTMMFDELKASNGNKFYFVNTGKNAASVLLPPYVRYSPAFGLYSGGRSYGSTGSYALADYGVKCTETDRYSVSMSAVIRLRNEALDNMSQMGLTNPLLVAWELVPFSFVADWFVNLSDILAQLDVWVGKQFVTGTVTNYDECLLKAESYQRSVPDTSPYTVKWIKPAQYTSKWTYINRVVLNQPPVVGLTFSIGLNPKRIADAVALFRTVVLNTRH